MAQRRAIVLTGSLALILRPVPVLLTRDLPIGLDDMFQYGALAGSIVPGSGYRWYAEDDLALKQHAGLLSPSPFSLSWLSIHSRRGARPIGLGLSKYLTVYPLALASENLLIPLLTLALATWTGHFADRDSVRKLGVGAGAGLGHFGRALWP